MPLDISHTRVGVATHISIKGSLSDREALDDLETELDEQIGQYQTNIVLDLVGVPLVNSRCLELFLDTQDRLQRIGGDLLLRNFNSSLRQLFEFTGISSAIDCGDQARTMPQQLNPQLKNLKMGELLVRKGLISEKDIEAAVKNQSSSGKKLGDILLEKRLISEANLSQVLAEQHNMPFIQVRTGLYDPEVVKLLDHDVARSLNVLPLFRLRGVLYLAIANPQAINAIDSVAEKTGLSIKPVIATENNIREVVTESHSLDNSLSDFIGELDVSADLEVVEGAEQDLDAIDQQAAASPVINLINGLVQRAVSDGASDIHIEPGRGNARIRFRIDGLLYQIMSPPAELYPALVSRLKVMAKLDIAERRLPQDGRIQVVTGGRVIDLRLSTLPGIHGEKVVLRVLDKTKAIMQLDKIGLSSDHLNLFKELLKHNHGLFLVTGPTGSGKTTTLYSAINELNSIEKSIVTIEDPVEYQLDIINQNQVREVIGLDFARLFRHVLRQDPDVVMVGEIRDPETAEIAVQAALTGHLVLSTLHTNDAIGAVTRLLDMGIQPFLLSSALIGVMAQRLIRRVCPSCKTTYTVPAEAMQQYGLKLTEKQELVRGKGCPECYDSGYKGRLAIHELLKVDADTQRLMMKNPSRDELDDHVKQKGMETLIDSALHNVLAGVTTIDEALRIAG